MKIEMKPLDGIYWEEKAIRLGDTKEQVVAVLGTPEGSNDIYYYNDMETSYSFDPDGLVTSIGNLDNEAAIGQVNEGDSKEQVRRILGEPEIISDVYYYFNTELAINFDGNNKVEYIEFIAGADGDIQPVIYGELAFYLESKELFELLKENNNGEIDDSEADTSYTFLEINVGIYRMSTESDVEEMIAELKEEGLSEEEIEENENVIIERAQAAHWSTIGIGYAGYYGAIS